MLHVCYAYQIDTRCVQYIEIDYVFSVQELSYTVDLNRLVGGVRQPKTSRSAMVCAKAQATLKREASKAKELVLQHALATYQEALASNQVL
jgi:hypothetical protein